MKKDGSCKNHYPKQFCDETTIDNDSFPRYRWRDNGASAKVRGHNLDNRWVVPYNPYLLAKFDSHINVEICSTIKAMKYLYKYIYKGHDRMHPFVYSLQLHLENQQAVSFYKSDNLTRVVNNDLLSKINVD
ncbi:hypothetical protein SLA2020_447350 [Shorea laevis]